MDLMVSEDMTKVVELTYVLQKQTILSVVNPPSMQQTVLRCSSILHVILPTSCSMLATYAVLTCRSPFDRGHAQQGLPDV